MLWHYAKLKWQDTQGEAAASLVPDIGYLQRNKTETTVTWVGHTSAFLQVAGLNVLIDPNFSSQLGSLGWLAPKRQQAPGLLISELPPVDVVFISNNQYDRLDEASMRELAAQHQPLFVVPRGVDKLLKSWGIAKVTALDAWGKLEVKGVQLQMTPAQTPSWRFKPAAKQSASG
ncbi:MAG: MBL fold metallo-hydrolase, partial [bacterium]